MLLALTNADRVSDLHLLDLNLKQVTSHGVRFQIARLSKTRRSGPPREATYVAFKSVKLFVQLLLWKPMNDVQLIYIHQIRTQTHCSSVA